MRILPEIVKGQARASRSVERARVLEIRESRARLETSSGSVWARCAIPDLSVGEYVTFARAGGEAHVLARARAPKETVKVVRV